MKILQIIDSVEGGGAEKLAVKLHHAYLEKKLDSHLLSLTNCCLINLPNIYYLNQRSPYQLSVLLKLYSCLRESRWNTLDVIHVHLFPAQFIVPIITKISGIKADLVTTEHTTFNRRRNTSFGKVIDNLFYKYYTKIICISSGVSNKMAEWQPCQISKLVTIYNGIELENYLSSKPLNRHRNKLILISVGRLEREKNHEAAIIAISKLQNLTFEYWIIGAGYLEPSLKELVVSLDLEDTVKFLGFCTNVAELLQQADIFLLTSLWEGFGLAVVEAMATGLPVIISDVPGVREILDDKCQCGFLVDPKSPDAIADRLSELIKNPELRSNMGNNARLRASQFSIEKTVDLHLKLYSEILNR